MSGHVELKGFGGPWTTDKLSILESYLNSYTTALKSQLFGLIYIDAFAGSASCDSWEPTRSTTGSTPPRYWSPR